MDRRRVERWLTGYERAWRAPGTEALAELFTSDVTYVVSSWAEPVDGLEALAARWESERQGSDEPFRMQVDVLAVEMETAVVRVDVDDAPAGTARRNLWVLTFTAGGRCARFEEWPHSALQPDGHEPAG